MFCSKCGAQLEEGAAFCTACGSPVNVAPQEPQPVAQEQPQPEPVQQSFEQVPPQPQPEPVQQSFEQVPPQPQPEPVQQSFEQVPPQPQYGQVPPQGQPYGQPPQQDYGPMTPAKKSAMVPILIAVIAAVVVATGVLLYFLVFRSSGGGGVPGKYHLAAVEYMGMTIDATAVPGVDNVSIELREDGTGTFSYTTRSEDVIWELNGSTLDIKSKAGKSIMDYMSTSGGSLEFKNGRIYLTMQAGSISGTSILAKEDDDLSDLDLASMDDLIKSFSSGITD